MLLPLGETNTKEQDAIHLSSYLLPSSDVHLQILTHGDDLKTRSKSSIDFIKPVAVATSKERLGKGKSSKANDHKSFISNPDNFLKESNGATCFQTDAQCYQRDDHLYQQDDAINKLLCYPGQMKQENAPSLSHSLPMTLEDLLREEDDDEKYSCLNDKQSTRNTSCSTHTFQPASSKLVPKLQDRRELIIPEYSLQLQNLLVDNLDVNKLSPEENPSRSSRQKYQLHMNNDEDSTITAHLSPVSISPSNLIPASPGQNNINRKVSPRRIASLLWVFKLIDILHCVPPEKQEQLITKAYWLRRWQTYVRKVKAERLRSFEQNQRAITFHSRRSKQECFQAWWMLVLDKSCKALRLREHHLQLKGMQALHWAVTRQRHQEQKAHYVHRCTVLKLVFYKWQRKWQCKQQHRLKNAFQKWQQRRLGEERYRLVEQLSTRQIQLKMFRRWRDQFETNNKERIATLYYKLGLLSRFIASWRLITQHKAADRQQKTMAKLYYEERTQKGMIQEWREQTRRSVLAKGHHSQTLLARVFQVLKRGVQISRVDCLEENSQAMEFRRKWLCKNCFRGWRRALSMHRTHKIMERKQVSRAFQIWCLKFQRCCIQTRLVTAIADKNLVLRYFKLWCVRIKDKHRSQMQATHLLMNLRKRIIFQQWLDYTRMRNSLRQKLKDFQGSAAMRCKRIAFSLWTSKHYARQSWSWQCARKAWRSWSRVIKQRKIEQRFIQSKDARDNKILKVYFRSWVLTKRRADFDTQRLMSVKKLLDQNLLHQILLEWHLRTKMSKVIAPMHHRSNKKLLCRVLHAWSAWSTNQHDLKQKMRRYQYGKLGLIFFNWRSQVRLLVKERNAKEQLMKCRTRQALYRWKCVVLRQRKMEEILHQNQQRQLRLLYLRWKAMHTMLQLSREIQLGSEARVYVLKRISIANWRSCVKEQLVEEKLCNIQVHRLQHNNRKRQAFKDWRQEYQRQILARRMQRVFQLRHFHSILFGWHQHASKEFQHSLNKFSMTVLAVCLTEGVDEGAGQTYLTKGSDESSHTSGGNLSMDSGHTQQTGSNNVHLRSSGQSSFEGHTTACELGLVSVMDVTDGIFHKPRSSSTSSVQKSRISSISNEQSSRCRSLSSLQRVKTSSLSSGQMSGSSVVHSCQGHIDSDTFISEDAFSRGINSDTWSCSYKDSGRCNSSSSTPYEMPDSRDDWLPVLPTDASTVIKLKLIITRWKFWPVSVAFEQWLMYVAHNRQLKLIQQQMQLRCDEINLKAAFQVWNRHTLAMKRAEVHYAHVIKSKCLQKLLQYKQHRQWKHARTETASRFAQRSLLTKNFIQWRIKWLENQQIAGVILTWQKYMGWSDEANRRAQKMVVKLQNTTLNECYDWWRLRQMQQQRVDQYRQSVVVGRCFSSWFQMVKVQTNTRKSMIQCRTKHIRKRAFGWWRLHLQAHYKVKKIILARQEKFLSLVIQTWHHHSNKMNQLRLIGTRVQQKWQECVMAITFHQWQDQTQRIWQARQIHNTTLLKRCMSGWVSVVQRKAKQQECLQRLRSSSFSSNLKESFILWKRLTLNQQKLRHWLNKKTEGRVKSAMGVWKEKRQERKVDRYCDKNMLVVAFRRWREWLVIEQRNKEKLHNALRHWKGQVHKAQQLQLQLIEWEVGREKLIKQRRFAIWKEALRKQQSAVLHNNQAVLMKTFQVWMCIAKHKRENKQKLVDFSSRRLQNYAWRIWKTKLEELNRTKNIKKILENNKTRRALTAWFQQVKKLKELTLTKQKVYEHVCSIKLKRAFQTWKLSMEKINAVKKQGQSALNTRTFMLKQNAFCKWKESALWQKAVRHNQRQLLIVMLGMWVKIAKEQRDKRRYEQDLEELADWHYQRRLRKVTLHMWYAQVKIEKLERRRQVWVLKKALIRWMDRTSQALKANKLAEYKLYCRFWKQWRITLATHRVMRTMQTTETILISSKVFTSWQHLSSLHQYGQQLKKQNSEVVLKASFCKWREVFNSLSSSDYSSPTPPTDNNSSCSSELAAIWEFQ